MEKVIEFVKKPWVIGAAAFALGLFIGLVVLGWGLWPVQWTDAAPTHLRADLQEEYLRMAMDSYARTGNIREAKTRWDDLGDKAPEALAAIKANPGAQSDVYLAFESAITVGGIPTPTPVAGAGAEQPSRFPWLLLGIMCFVTLLLAIALAAFFLLRGRGGPAVVTPAMEAQQAAREAPMTDYAALGEEPPMAQFMASYKLGDDLFDDSFSIDSPSGEFMGECGVGISETIGVGDPKKVTAFEVWLFDKNDIQTVTKVLMSSHAFQDETIRQRLAAKGEPTLAQPGQQVVLETQTLQLVGRVVDMSYGEGALPPESFFGEIILELAIWQK